MHLIGRVRAVDLLGTNKYPYLGCDKDTYTHIGKDLLGDGLHEGPSLAPRGLGRVQPISVITVVMVIRVARVISVIRLIRE